MEGNSDSYRLNCCESCLIFLSDASIAWAIYYLPAKLSFFINDKCSANRKTAICVEDTIRSRDSAMWPEVSEKAELITFSFGECFIGVHRIARDCK